MNDDRVDVTGTRDRGHGFWFAAAGACTAGLVAGLALAFTGGTSAPPAAGG